MLISRLTEQGAGVVYVSHKLDELFRMCDRITVRRDGRKVTKVHASEGSSEELVRLMAGCQPASRRISGLMGFGRTDLARALFELDRAMGDVHVGGGRPQGTRSGADRHHPGTT